MPHLAWLFTALFGVALVAVLSLWTRERGRSSQEHRRALEEQKRQCTKTTEKLQESYTELQDELAELRTAQSSATEIHATLARALSLLRETAPIVSGLGGAAIEKSRSGSTSLTDDIYALGERSTSLSTTIRAFLADLCEGDESLEHNVGELTEDVARLGEVASLFDRTSATLEVSVGSISEAVSSNVELLSKVSDIAEQTGVLAINAAIYAAKAGNFGRGFGVIAGEIQKLARTAKDVAEAVGSNTKGIEERVATFGAEQRQVMVESRSSLDEITASIRHTIADLRPQINRISGSVQAAADTSSEVTDRLSGINMTLQQHDAIQQMITHISDILNDALNEAPDATGLNGFRAEDIKARAREIAARRFTMKDEFDAVGVEGYEVERGKLAVLDDGTALKGDITLF